MINFWFGMWVRLPLLYIVPGMTRVPQPRGSPGRVTNPAISQGQAEKWAGLKVL